MQERLQPRLAGSCWQGFGIAAKSRSYSRSYGYNGADPARIINAGPYSEHPGFPNILGSFEQHT